MKGYKTAIVSLLLIVFGALQGFDWATLITDPKIMGLVTAGIGVIMFALRAITNTPMLNNDK